MPVETCVRHISFFENVKEYTNRVYTYIFERHDGLHFEVFPIKKGLYKRM